MKCKTDFALNAFVTFELTDLRFRNSPVLLTASHFSYLSACLFLGCICLASRHVRKQQCDVTWWDSRRLLCQRCLYPVLSCFSFCSLFYFCVFVLYLCICAGFISGCLLLIKHVNKKGMNNSNEEII